ncbi:hypothetical protein N656DRAFT_703708 [Canariomyces notabilis]|uniref:Heterokaryon incompatibility domain-containing protein n=1 Tax=Canariomyces notabilis TaxID=2074819 RepID=A0AAN6YVJ6_9PEZI|nr:hypothetical protein N656DRAFT_703708 [Canariomyces arenarius]
MSAAGNPFVYPPLPVEADSIRILSVEPGDFYDPLVCTLTPTTFGSKPRYVALSYTWGISYPDNARLPVVPPVTPVHEGRTRTPPNASTRASLAPDNQVLPRARTVTMSHTAPVSVNGREFPIHHNLHLALLHLRSPTHPLAVWVDAVCIDQGNIEERNAQVALMSFIYMRAAKVVVWLGAKGYHESQPDLFRCMAMDWKTGQSRHLAESLSRGFEPCCSLEPDQSTFVRVAQSSYWTRLWIVQEACLPRALIFLYGSKAWSYEGLRQWETLKTANKPGLPPQMLLRSPAQHHENEGAAAAMIRLLDTRGARHTERMTLEFLVEAFSKQACTELRDRVFALLGLAIDVRPRSKHAEGDSGEGATPDGSGAVPGN